MWEVYLYFCWCQTIQTRFPKHRVDTHLYRLFPFLNVIEYTSDKVKLPSMFRRSPRHSGITSSLYASIPLPTLTDISITRHVYRVHSHSPTLQEQIVPLPSGRHCVILQTLWHRLWTCNRPREQPNALEIATSVPNVRSSLSNIQIHWHKESSLRAENSTLKII